MTAALLDRPAHEIAAGVKARRTTARDITEAAIARVETTRQLGAFTDTTFARARREAASVDAAVAAGVPLPLAGGPFAV